MAKKNFYCVKKGLTPGIYTDWESCKAQVQGFPGAVYKGFATIEEAKAYMGEQSTPTIAESEAVAYVDGSYNTATGEYGCGVVFFYDGTETHLCEKGNDVELATMRNVAGEILGATLAMKYAIEHGIRQLSIYYDYQGIASWCLGEWKTNKEGTVAYKRYYDGIKEQLKVNFCKVKGHSGNQWNDLADELAKQSVGVI